MDLKQMSVSIVRLFLTFINDYIQDARVYAIKLKNPVYDCSVEWIIEIDNLTGCSIFNSLLGQNSISVSSRNHLARCGMLVLTVTQVIAIKKLKFSNVK